MATLEQIESALRKADAAGNVADARRLAAAYREARKAQTSPSAIGASAYDQALADASARSRRLQFDPNASPAGQPDLAGSTAATLGGLVNGIPVIGPMAQNLTDAVIGTGLQLTGNGTMEEYRADARRRREQLEQANPVAAVAGNLAGGIGAYGALAKTAAGAQALGVGPGMGLGARIGNSAASGAAISGADASVKGGSLNDMLTAATYGGAIGAITPPIASGLGMAARAIGSKIAPAVNAAARPADEAARRTGQVLLRDQQINPAGMIGANDEAVARQAGIPLMNVDRGGETTRALARSVANQSPEARSIITKAADERFETQGIRAVDFIRRLTGGQADDLAYQQGIRDAAKVVNTPRYKAAWEAPGAQAVWSPQIRQLMQSPQFLSAVRMAETRGADKAAISGFKAVKNPFTFGPDGSIGLRTNADGSRALPSLAFWNQVKINLDGMIERAQRGAKPDRSLYSDLTQMKQMLVSELDAAVPQYRTARQGAAAFFGADDALEAGKKFANQPRNVPEAQRAFASFNDAEKQAFQTGYASELIDRIRSTRDRVNVVNQVFGNQSSRDMIELVFGPGKARQLEAYVRVESLADAIRGALGNSTTARQLIELGIGSGIGGAAGFGLSGGNFGAAMQGAALGAGAKGAQMLGQRIDASVMKEVARLLTSRDPADIQRAIANATMSPEWMKAITAMELQLQIASRPALAPTGS